MQLMGSMESMESMENMQSMGSVSLQNRELVMLLPVMLLLVVRALRHRHRLLESYARGRLRAMVATA